MPTGSKLTLIVGSYCRIAPDGSRQDVPSLESAAEEGKEKRGTSSERAPSLDHSEASENHGSNLNAPEGTTASSPSIVPATSFHQKVLSISRKEEVQLRLYL